MDLQQLACFVAVAEHSHFTRAATALNLAQPHVSREVARLERDLGLRLFERTTREVRLTDAGVEFLVYARRMFEQLDEGKERARAISEGRRGTIVVAFAGSVTYSWLPFLTQAFRREFPQVAMEIRSEVLTGAQLEAIAGGTIDVGLLRPPVADANIQTLVLDNEPLVVALPGEHRLARASGPLDVTDLQHEPFIGYRSSASSTHKAVLQVCLDAGFAPTIVQSVSETHSLVALVAAGMGVALVPNSTRHFAVRGVRYRPLSAGAIRLPLLLAWRAAPTSAAVQRFVELVRTLGRPDDEADRGSGSITRSRSRR